MEWIMILGFALSSSLDNLGVGISYGIRGIRIGHWANLMIAVICFLFSITGIVGGQWLSRVLPGVLPDLVGAGLLFMIGVRIIMLAVPRKKAASAAEVPDQPASRSLTALLQNPETADADQSGTIGIGESVILGAALSANAVTNGLGAGLIGLSPLAISITAAIGSFVMIWLGVSLGRKAAGVRLGSFTLGQFGTVLSGVILVIMAWNLLLG